MRLRPLLRVVMPVAILAAALVGCGGADDEVASPFTLTVEPEFVQGAIPGAVTGVMVTIESETEAPVALTATATDAEVTVVPGTISPGEVAEVTVVAAAGADGRPMEIVVTGRRGDVEATGTRSTTVFDWADDRAGYAATLLGLFTTWLEAERPDLGITPDTEFSGSLVAPGLLVVSHYLFLSDDWEVGLSWHVMIPPDDWSEIYFRPRGGGVPTLAFRLSSQAGALEGGVVEISEAPPPVEVMR
jgi:hypothetical protein